MHDARSLSGSPTDEAPPSVGEALVELRDALGDLACLLGRAARHGALVLIALAWLHRRDLTIAALGALASGMLMWATVTWWYGPPGPMGLASPSGVVFAAALPPSTATPEPARPTAAVPTATSAPPATSAPAASGDIVAWPTWMPRSVMQWASLAEAAGRRHGVDPVLVTIVILVESGGQPAAQSSAGATGLMQVMPGTAADIVRTLGMDPIDPAALGDPAVCVDLGTWYLSKQLLAFGLTDDPDWQTSVERAAAAYNGGPGNAGKWLRGGGLSAETTAYVRWVGGMWRERRDPTSPTFDAWRAAGGDVLL